MALHESLLGLRQARHGHDDVVHATGVDGVLNERIGDRFGVGLGRRVAYQRCKRLRIGHSAVDCDPGFCAIRQIEPWNVSVQVR